MPTVIVRQAALADIGKIVPLFDDYRQFYDQLSDEAAVRDFLRERFEQEDSVLFVAEVENRAVGFTQLYPTFSSVSLARTFLLNDLFVLPEARKSGVGRSLLTAATDYARELGAIRLSLSTAITNKAGQSLYEGAGWQRDEIFYVYHFATNV